MQGIPTMSNIQIFQISEAFNEDYAAMNGHHADMAGFTRGGLLGATTHAYLRLWEEKYAGNPNIEQMREAEGINFTDAHAALSAFVQSSTAQTDTLQSGDDKAMYIAIDKDTLQVEGLIQISNLNFAKFAERRREALDHVHAAAMRHTGREESLEEALEHVCKPQREYHSDAVIGAALMKAALAGSPATSAFIVSYDAAEAEIGYEAVAETTTMDSGTPCFFMVGKNETVIGKLEEQIDSPDAPHNIEYAPSLNM